MELIAQVSNRVGFAGIEAEFRDFASRNMLAQWQWKLNPYEIGDASRSPRGIAITQTDESAPIPDHDLELLRDEPAGFFRRMVYRLPDGGTLWQFVRRVNHEVSLQYRVNGDWDRIDLLVDETRTAGQVAFEYLGQMMPCVLLKHKILTFHGVLMEHNGRGIIISADSGVGKTTHARLWRDHRNALIINGDRATCRNVNGVWTGFGLPWSGSSGEQINRSVPLQALVVLERGEVNQAHPVTGLEAFGGVLPHMQCPAWDEELTGTAMDLLDDFLGAIPVIRLRCRPDVEAVEVLQKVLEEL